MIDGNGAKDSRTHQVGKNYLVDGKQVINHSLQNAIFWNYVPSFTKELYEFEIIALQTRRKARRLPCEPVTFG